MCVCLCVCVCVYLCLCVTYMYIYIYIHIHILIHLHIHTHTNACTYTYIIHIYRAFSANSASGQHTTHMRRSSRSLSSRPFLTTMMNSRGELPGPRTVLPVFVFPSATRKNTRIKKKIRKCQTLPISSRGTPRTTKILSRENTKGNSTRTRTQYSSTEL